ncbi:hypothetical protein ACG9YY_11770 [Acinetobacter pittii]
MSNKAVKINIQNTSSDLHTKGYQPQKVNSSGASNTQPPKKP